MGSTSGSARRFRLEALGVPAAYLLLVMLELVWCGSLSLSLSLHLFLFFPLSLFSHLVSPPQGKAAGPLNAIPTNVAGAPMPIGHPIQDKNLAVFKETFSQQGVRFIEVAAAPGQATRTEVIQQDAAFACRQLARMFIHINP